MWVRIAYLQFSRIIMAWFKLRAQTLFACTSTGFFIFSPTPPNAPRSGLMNDGLARPHACSGPRGGRRKRRASSLAGVRERSHVRPHPPASGTTCRWATSSRAAGPPPRRLSLSPSLKVGRPVVADCSEARCPLVGRRPVAYSGADGPKLGRRTGSTLAVA
jgi:hypothetical protein